MEILICNACVAELVDALDSKSSVSDNVSVRVRPQAPINAIKPLRKKGFIFFTLKITLTIIGYIEKAGIRLLLK